MGLKKNKNEKKTGAPATLATLLETEPLPALEQVGRSVEEERRVLSDWTRRWSRVVMVTAVMTEELAGGGGRGSRTAACGPVAVGPFSTTNNAGPTRPGYPTTGDSLAVAGLRDLGLGRWGRQQRAGLVRGKSPTGWRWLGWLTAQFRDVDGGKGSEKVENGRGGGTGGLDELEAIGSGGCARAGVGEAAGVSFRHSSTSVVEEGGSRRDWWRLERQRRASLTIVNTRQNEGDDMEEKNLANTVLFFVSPLMACGSPSYL